MHVAADRRPARARVPGVDGARAFRGAPLVARAANLTLGPRGAYCASAREPPRRHLNKLEDADEFLALAFRVVRHWLDSPRSVIRIDAPAARDDDRARRRHAGYGVHLRRGDLPLDRPPRPRS